MQPTFYEDVIAILKEHGYKNTTFDKIALRTGVGRSTLFTKYKNKEELIYKAIYQETVSAENLVFSTELTYEDLSQDIPLLLGEYLRLYMKQMPVYRLFMLPALHDNELNQQIYKKIRTLINHFAAYLEKMNQLGKITDIPYEDFSDMLFSTILERALTLTAKQVDYEDGQTKKIIDELAKQCTGFLTK